MKQYSLSPLSEADRLLNYHSETLLLAKAGLKVLAKYLVAQPEGILRSAAFCLTGGGVKSFSLCQTWTFRQNQEFYFGHCSVQTMNQPVLTQTECHNYQFLKKQTEKNTFPPNELELNHATR